MKNNSTSYNLNYFTEEGKKGTLKGSFVIDKATKVEQCDSSAGPSNLKNNFFFRVTTADKNILLAANTDAERKEWVTIINALFRPVSVSQKVPSSESSKESTADVNARMIKLSNDLLQAWVANDQTAYFAIASERIVLDIPAFNVKTDSRDAAWAIRGSMGPDPLDPHDLTGDPVVEMSPKSVKTGMQITSKKTGKVYGRSELTLYFDSDGKRVTKYAQNVLFFEPETTAEPKPFSEEMANRMIYLSNSLMKAWVNNDRSGYAAVAADNIALDIPAFGVKTESLDNAWAVRGSLGKKPLDPHILANHVIIESDNSVKATMQITSLRSGKVYGVSELQLTFDKHARKVVRYFQDVKFFQPEEQPMNEEEANRMIYLGNALLKAWVSHDRTGYAAVAAENISLDIPAFNVATDDLEKAWSVRSSMGSKPLDPHVASSHVVDAKEKKVTFSMAVISLYNGETYGFSSVELHFDTHCRKVIKYKQDVKFLSQPPKPEEKFVDPWAMN